MDSRILLTSGLSFGSGLAPRGSGNAGSEFNAASFSAAATLQATIDAGDYLTFAVQPIDGMALYPDSVSFAMWRDDVDSPTDFPYFERGSILGGLATSAISPNGDRRRQ